jgi:1,4-alpha-glucan branching enzyme
VRFNSDWAGYSPDFGAVHSYDTDAEALPRDELLPVSADVGVGPYTALVLSQDA